MRFELLYESQIYKNFRKECIDNNAWHHISWDKITWVETFEKMGFKTYKVIDEIVDGKYLEHYLDDHEYTWFVMRFS